jgi:hypothetical protein
MTGSATDIWIICAVIVAGLVTWLSLVAWAARHPGHKNRRMEHTRGLVQGGQHVGGGRSVMPHRDAPVPEGGGTPPEPEDQVEGSDAGRAGSRRSGSPMDL